MQKPVEKRKDMSWLFLLLLILGVLIILYANEDANKQAQAEHPGGVTSPEQMSLVNKHLKETAINLQKDRLQRMRDKSRELQDFHNTGQQDPYQVQHNFNLDSDQRMQQLSEDLNRSREIQENQLTPEQIVQRRLYEDEQFQKENAAYREQYAEEFIENARQGGWDVKLGPNFEVLSVKKIPKQRAPTQYLFDGNSAGSR